MFKKADERTVKLASVVNQGSLNTILGDGSRFNGSLHVEGSVRVDGTYDGVLTATETIIIGRTGFAKADLQAREILVSGRIDGKLTAAERVELHEGAHVDGDVFSQHFMIADGVVFNGRCSMSTDGSQPGDTEVGGREAASDQVTSVLQVVEHG